MEVRTETEVPKFKNSNMQGNAAEHLVCYEFLSRGYNAYLTSEGASFDIIVETSNGLLRVQVKSACRPQLIPSASSKGRGRSNHFYIFNVGSTSSRKNPKRQFETTRQDIIAFVALDIKQIAYMTPSRIGGVTTKSMSPKNMSKYPLEDVLRDL